MIYKYYDAKNNKKKNKMEKEKMSCRKSTKLIE